MEHMLPLIQTLLVFRKATEVFGMDASFHVAHRLTSIDSAINASIALSKA